MSKPYIFDFDEYEYMIIESDDGEIIAELKQDSINIEDGYRVRMMPRKEQVEEDFYESLPFENAIKLISEKIRENGSPYVEVTITSDAVKFKETVVGIKL